MSVTAAIIRAMIDGGLGTGENIILVAEAMERGPNAAMMFKLVAELEEIDAPADRKAAAIWGFAKAIVQTEVARRQTRENNTPYGPEARWGYTGPVTPRLPEKDWWPLRRAILERDQYICQYCASQSERMCADHVVPLSRGGTNDPENLVACCIPCNSSKCDKLVGEWEGRYGA